jgi:hypothetical protein
METLYSILPSLPYKFPFALSFHQPMVGWCQNKTMLGHVQGFLHIMRHHIWHTVFTLAPTAEFWKNYVNHQNWHSFFWNWRHSGHAQVWFFYKLFISNQNYIRFYKLICCDSIWHEEAYNRFYWPRSKFFIVKLNSFL